MIDPLQPLGEGSGAAPVTTARVAAHQPWRVGLALVAALALVAVAAVAIGASPLASSSPSANAGASSTPGASASPKASSGPKSDGRSGARGGFGFGPPFRMGPAGRPFGLGLGFGFGLGFRQVTVTAVSGSSVSLKTADGWTRTITVSSGTKITKGDATISVGQLEPGDSVRLQERRQSDGTYTITAIRVIPPTTIGQVTAKTGTTITIRRPNGDSQTIKVSGATTYHVAGHSQATLADVTVGMDLVAQGTANPDGSFTASTVFALEPGARMGPTTPHHPMGNGPQATPGPSASPASNL